MMPESRDYNDFDEIGFEPDEMVMDAGHGITLSAGLDPALEIRAIALNCAALALQGRPADRSQIIAYAQFFETYLKGE